MALQLRLNGIFMCDIFDLNFLPNEKFSHDFKMHLHIIFFFFNKVSSINNGNVFYVCVRVQRALTLCFHCIWFVFCCLYLSLRSRVEYVFSSPFFNVRYLVTETRSILKNKNEHQNPKKKASFWKILLYPSSLAMNHCIEE